jgi:predicted DCC family thiol-disulfide oxidoreductase YuxK
MTTEELLKKQPILLFDGECGFCNKSIQFFLKREKNKNMHFVPLESEIGKQLKTYFEIKPNVDSVILIKDYNAFIKSCAALRLTLYMKNAWPLMMVFVIIPPFIRNMFYNLIAKNRMRFFGRVQSCELLAKEDKTRFL